MNIEQWRAVVGYEGTYEVSSYGRVRNARTGYVLKQTLVRGGKHAGRYQVSLWHEGKAHARGVHTLVIAAFHGPRPPGMQCRHLDGDKANNHADNLRWGTHAENEIDKVQHGTHQNAIKTHCPKGHEYTPENTRLQVKATTVGRICRTCERARRR